MKTKTKRVHIAPCGMNCAICLGFQRSKNTCNGCNERNNSKAIEEIRCTIVKCKEKSNITDYCYKCDKFPCRRMKELDKRYKTRYGMSMIENLLYIKENGINKFVKKENARWKCEKCGELICVHRRLCLKCSPVYEKKNKK